MNLQHHFLIAMPALQDPIFRRSVVYICEYNEDGAMGIIINKPLENLQVEGILEKLKIEAEERLPEIRLDKPVMLGGPLAEDRGLSCIRLRRSLPVFVSLITPLSRRLATYSKHWAPRISLLKCWLPWAIPHGKKASSNKRSWIMPGSRPLPI
jgi:putative transcriptional regulator